MLPSGNQAGANADTGLLVNCFGAPPRVETTQISL